MVVPFAHHAPAISDSIHISKGSSGITSRAFFVQVADLFDPQSHRLLSRLSTNSFFRLEGVRGRQGEWEKQSVFAPPLPLQNLIDNKYLNRVMIKALQSHAELLLSQRSLLLLRGSSPGPLGIAVLDQTVLAQLSLD
jgi:hypothetical protein